MAIKVMAWNLQEGLALAERSPALVEAIIQHDADVAVLTDAYWLGNPLHGARSEVAEAAFTKFEAAGYKTLGVEYGDDHRWQSRWLVLLSRLAIVRSFDEIKLGHRNSIDHFVSDPATNTHLRIMGAHFDDRNDKLRLKQADAVVNHLKTGQPTALIGDLNSLHSREFTSRLAGNRLSRAAIRHLPMGETKRYYGQRLAEMATSQVLDTLAEYGLKDADHAHRPTFPSHRPLFQLDHCLVSDIFVPHFEVASHNPASDHRAIMATLET